MTPRDFSAMQAVFAPYARYVPGFAFLQGLAGGAAAPPGQAPAMAQWVAPVFDPDELERRIRDLRAVHFWLEQNARAVQATIQALEVQRMTLATLKGLNVSLGEVARVWSPGAAGGTPRADAVSGEAPAPGSDPAPPGGDAAAPTVDPMRWWQALTEQFQGIAQRTLQEMTQQTAAPMAPMAAAPAPPATAVSGEAPARNGRKVLARRATSAPGASAPAPAAARRTRR